MTTGDNERFLRMWHEVSKNNIGMNAINAEEAAKTGCEWFPYNKGGGYRKWYGLNEYVVLWKNNGEAIKSATRKGKKIASVRSERLYFKESITWATLTSGSFSARHSEAGHLFDDKGSSAFLPPNYIYYALALMNVKVTNSILAMLNPTISFQSGNIGSIPVIYSDNYAAEITERTKECVSISKIDWDSFENSWDFEMHPLVRLADSLWDATTVGATMQHYYGGHPEVSCPLELTYMLWQGECNERFKQLKSNEEELNRIFIDIYGLQDELTPDVEDKDVTVRKADLQRDIKSLLSYVVGCMFGRYSLSTEGLAYAGGEWDASKYSDFLPDEDNVILITDQKYMDDDIVERLCEFLKVVYGENSLESNLDFIANALGGKGATSREIIRNYFLNDFFKDHCKTYQKRPIYWLFDSGKQNGFKALVYMHRWDKNSIGRVLVYLHKIQEKYEIEVRAIDAMLEHMTDKRQQAAEEQRRDHLLKQITEIKEYDERLDHMTNEHIDIDLDDGVKVNYEKVQTDRNGTKFKILAPIK